MGTIGNAKGKLEQHQKENIGICDDLSNLVPLEVIVFHASLVTSDSIDRINALLFIEEARSTGSVGQKNSQYDGPDESNETKDNKEPLTQD
jgi:hypothetical protein